MTFEKIIDTFTRAVEAGDGARLAALFTPNGTYVDQFYGEFHGRDAIKSMLEKHFWGQAKDFTWAMTDLVSDDDLGYGKYRFSYVSTIPGSEGRQVVFTGMSQFRLLDGLILKYQEEFNTGLALVQLGFPAARIERHLMKKARLLSSD